MKFISTLLTLCFLSIICNAQWSNKTNYFSDSSHMPVCADARTQQHSMVIKSYPDGGYILFWEDMRNTASQQDIYAQKFDKNGVALWAANGVPVTTGPNNQRLFSSSNADYRNYSYAATDSAGGFYITYIDDSINNYLWPRICVQHMRKNGSPVFSGAGYIIATTPIGGSFTLGSPQLIADGNKGFYIAYLRLYPGTQDLDVNCYREENGTMKYYGGGQMNINAYESPTGSCNNNVIAYRGAYVSDYMIYPDLQNGCNTVMTLSQNAGGNERTYMGYNRLVRVKKDSKVKITKSNVINYPKDSVLVFYKVIYHTYTFQCGNTSGTGYILDGNGYLQISDLAYGDEFSKGVAVPTDGNINVNVFAFTERRYLNNTLTNWFTHAFYRSDEKHDSIPYAFTVFPYQPESYRGGPKPGQNKVNYDNDTILYNNSVYDYDFCLATGANKIYATALIYNLSNQRDVLLQQLQVKRINTDSFAVQFVTGNTNKAGIKIGSEITPGSFNNPQIATDNNGNALFYIRDYLRQVRVSPIINGTQLAWGAMGRLIGSGAFTNGYYYPENPFVTLGPVNGTGVVCWEDSRNIPINTGVNIYTRHLDSINKANYAPPYKRVKLLVTGGQAMPYYLAGSSKHYSLIEYLNYNSNGTFSDASPVVEIKDKYNLGSMSVNIFQNNAAIRTYNSKPYLNRNFTIQPQTNPKTGNTINLRLFFTSEEFNALKAVSPSVHKPSDLAVIKQPYTSGNAPAMYTPIAGEQKILVQSWKAVLGGYYIEIAVTGFTGYTNYFIFPSAIVTPVPLAAATSQNNLIPGNTIFIEKMYPTPTVDGTVYIKTGNATVEQMLIEVYSIDGKLCYKKMQAYQPQKLQLNLLQSGVYEIRITSGALVFSAPLIKK